MKKFAILTSLLALAACGGGNGGSSGAPGIAPQPVFVPTEDTVGNSNSKITRMVSNSEHQVAVFVSNKLGADAESVGLGNITARGATTRAAFVPNPTGNLDYDKAAELVDMAEWLAKSDTNADDIIAEFNQDRNKIKVALKLMDDMYCYVGGSAEETARRILEKRASNTFETPLKDLIAKTEILTLDGVDLYTAPWSDTLTRLTFNVDKNGRIESVEYPDAEEILEEQPGADIYVGPMMRDGETAFFIQQDKLTKEEMTDDNGDGNIISNPDYIKGDLIGAHKHEYISYAKDLGLKYSNFGILRTDFKNSTFNGDEALTPEGQQELKQHLEDWGVLIDVFAGGYTEKQISKEQMTTLAQNGNITFTGLAVGDVRYRDGLAYGGNGIDIPLTDDSMRDDAATLVFDNNGNQTLTVDFSDDWYKFAVIKNADGKNTFQILGGDGGADERFHLDPEKVANNITDSAETDNPHYNNDGTQWHNTMVFKPGYYGSNNETPEEATAIINYQFAPNEVVMDEHNNPVDGHGNIGVVVGFGGTNDLNK